MPNIFTRPKILEILQDESLDIDERLNRIMSLRGRDLDDGYVTKAAAKEDRESAVEQARAEWQKSQPAPDIKGSEEYKALESKFAGYKAMQEAKGSETFKGVKPKFFETVYGMFNSSDKPEEERMSAIREQWPEYFAEEQPEKTEEPKNLPQYSQNPGRPGTNPESEEDKLFKKLSEQWR